VSGAKELAALRGAIEQLATLNVDGVVLGFARGGALDLETTRAVLAGRPAVRVTFHRAFDVVHDPIAALDALREIPQIDRVLTSGGTADWKARCEMLKRYAARAGATLTVLAGGGVDAAALSLIAASGCVREAHVGRAAREPQVRDAPVSADRVRRLRQIADGGA
jgi:copper homeostasis protein